MNGNGDAATPLADLATVMHEMFMSLVFAGFSDEQAMRLTVLWVVESGGGRQFPRPT